MNRQGQLIVYSGPSGVGKGTLLAPLLLDSCCHLALSVSATTRPPRPGEVDGVHYHFVTHEAFSEMIAQDSLLEYAQYGGNFYGTPRHSVETMLMNGLDVVLEIEVQGALQIMEKYPAVLTVFVMPPSLDELCSRLKKRGTESADQLAVRLNAALNEVGHAAQYDFIIVNDDLELARAQLLRSIAAGPYLSKRNLKLINEVLGVC